MTRKYRSSEKGIATYKKYREEHREQIRAAGRRYREANRERIRERKRVARRAWRESHPERARAQYLADAKRWRKADPIRTILRDAKKRAKSNGIEFTITEDDITLPSHCPVLGIPLIPRGRPMVHTNPSLDRLDPRKGYVKGNVSVISWRANKLKADVVDPRELRSVVEWMEKELARCQDPV